MSAKLTSNRIERLTASIAGILSFITQSAYAERVGDPAVADFAFGNPHDMPLPGLVAALQKWTVPQHKDWFAYKMCVPEAQEAIAAALRERRGLDFEAQDILLTNGAFAALASALATLIDPGDEVIFISPPWFFYEALILAAGATPVRVQVDPISFDLDVQAIERALTARTRAVIVNSPNNPTGRIYPPATLTALAQALSRAGERFGGPIYLLSDEAYNRIIFDGRPFHSPAEYYPHTIILYTYGKTLLAPGERIGYMALPPSMPDRDELRQALTVGQVMTGYAYPNAVPQYAVPELEQLSIDIPRLQAKRDRLVAALGAAGYELQVPEGTFYVMVRSPWPDDVAFCALLAEHDILCLPGRIVEMPGYFRISLTANEDMIERSLAGFAAARHARHAGKG